VDAFEVELSFDVDVILYDELVSKIELVTGGVVATGTDVLVVVVHVLGAPGGHPVGI
jgi:hypothetical protein